MRYNRRRGQSAAVRSSPRFRTIFHSYPQNVDSFCGTGIPMVESSSQRRRLGQFFTPTPVVACAYGLLRGRLPPHPLIADPACGDGAFLRFAAAHGLAAPAALAGCDVDGALVARLAAEGLPGVRRADGLAADSLPAAAFDLVVGNPPFGVATPRDGSPLASEARFLLRALDLVRPGGYIALVLPSGILANERLRGMRADLLRRVTLLAVLDLPRETFRRVRTSAACSLLVVQAAPAPAGHRAFFGIAASLDDLPALVAAFHGPAPALQPAGALPTAGGAPSHTRCASPHLSDYFWVEQGPALAERLDAHFWQPSFQRLMERLAAPPFVALGELLGRGGLLAGDHVRPSRGESKGPGLPYEYYQTREFLPAGYNFARIERCDERAFRRLARTAVQRGDVLVSCAGIGGAGRGRVCLVTHEPGPSCTGDVFILRPAGIDPTYLFLFLGGRWGRAQLLRLQNGVGTANLSAGELRQVRVPLVPLPEQRRFAAAYAPARAAHDRSVAALRRGDAAAFARGQARAAALLAAAREHLDRAVDGGCGEGMAKNECQARAPRSQGERVGG
jgi:type I restriction enzyme M protein